MKSILIEDSANKAVREYTSYILNGRVLPRLDGLKPVQRRVLWAMILMGCRKKFRKSAIIIGETMKYHAHGDSSIHTSLINLVNSPNSLVEGQGNWGSEEDSKAAAPRYTEAKTSEIFENLFDDSCLDRSLGDFVPNFSEDEIEPYNFQFKVPLARLIGVNGIGMGFATSCPAISFNCLKDNLFKTIEDSSHIMSDVEYAYGGSEYKNIIYPSMEIITRGDKKYLHITDIPIGSTKMKMNKSEYLRELVLSDQMEIIDESDVLNEKMPISIFLNGPKSALKLVIDSMKRKVPDYLYYYNGRLRSSEYEVSWLDFRRNYIAKRQYYIKEKDAFDYFQKKSLSIISNTIEGSDKKIKFLDLANNVGKDMYKEYVSVILPEEAKQFIKSEDKFISSLVSKSISSVKNYNLGKISPIKEISKDELNNIIIEEIESLDSKIFSKPTKKLVRFPNIDGSFSSDVKRYIVLRNGNIPEISFKNIPRLVNFETSGDIHFVYDNGVSELVDGKFFGEAKKEDGKNLVGFMIDDLPTVFVTLSNKIICYKRISKIDEIIKSAFPACVLMINGKKKKMRAGMIIEDVKEYKIVSTLED